MTIYRVPFSSFPSANSGETRGTSFDLKKGQLYIDQQPTVAGELGQLVLFSKTHAQVRIIALPFKAVVIK